MHRDPPVGRLYALRQGVQGGHHAVELPAAVVAYDDAITPVLYRQQGIFGSQHPFDPYLHLRPRLEPGYLPRPTVRVVVESGEAAKVGLGSDLFGGPPNDGKFKPLRKLEIVSPLVIPDSEDGGIRGQEDRLAAGRFRLSDDGFFEPVVPHRVQLDGVVYGAYICCCRPHGFDAVV